MAQYGCNPLHQDMVDHVCVIQAGKDVASLLDTIKQQQDTIAYGIIKTRQKKYKCAVV